jgi:hypothetical protein
MVRLLAFLEALCLRLRAGLRQRRKGIIPCFSQAGAPGYASFGPAGLISPSNAIGLQANAPLPLRQCFHRSAMGRGCKHLDRSFYIPCVSQSAREEPAGLTCG